MAEHAVAFLAPVVAPAKLQAVCYRATRGISEVVYFALEFTFVPFRDAAENRTYSHACLNQLSKSVTPSECSYSSRAGWRHRIELQRAAHFQGVKNVLVPGFVNVSNQVAGKEGSWCAWCQLLWWRAESRTVTSSHRSSKGSSPVGFLHPEPGRQGPLMHLIPRVGPWINSGEQWQELKQVVRTAKLTWSLQKDTEYYPPDFIDRNA